MLERLYIIIAHLNIVDYKYYANMVQTVDNVVSKNIYFMSISPFNHIRPFNYKKRKFIITIVSIYLYKN